MSDFPPALPFEYRVRQRNIPWENPDAARRILEQRDRELEDFLATLGTGSGAAPAAAASWENNDSVLFGSPQAVFWNTLPYTWSEDYDLYLHVETGETNDRIDVDFPGFYTATMTVESSTSAILHSVTAHSAGFEGHTGTAEGSVTDPLNGNTSFTAYAMQVGDYFTAEVDGTMDESFAAYITIEYVAPYGGALEVEEG